MQPDLFSLPEFLPIVVPADDIRSQSLPERARRFHEANPQVMRMAVDLAHYMQRKGLRHYSIKAIWEVLRFKYFETTGDVYKLNNNYHAWYAREIMATVPDLAGFFTTRGDDGLSTPE